MARSVRIPVLILGALVALVAMISGNLSGLGIGDMTLLYDSIALPRLAIAVTLVPAAWAAYLLFEGRRAELRTDLVWTLLGVLAAWAAVSAAFSPHRVLAILGQSERLEGVVAMVLYAAVYGIALQTLGAEKDLRLVATFLSVAAVGLSLLGIAQYAGIDPTSYSFEMYGFDMHRAFATFGNPNFFASLLVLALPVIVALAISANSQVVRALWATGALLALVALFATFTRGAWLAAGVEVVFAIIMWARAPRRRLSSGVRIGLAVAVAVVVTLALLSVNAPAESNLISRLGDTFSPSGSASERSLLVGIALSAATARPLVGYGPDSFLPAFRLHRTDAYVDAFNSYGVVNNAHSWPLQYAATLGFVGAALLIAAIVVGLWRSRGRLVKPSASAEDVMLGGVWLGCIGFAVHMLFSVSVLGATVPFWLLFGALGATRASVRRPSGRVLRVAGMVFAALTVAAAIAAVAFVRADALYLQSRRAFSAKDFPTSLSLARQASSSNPVSLKYARGVAETSGELVVQAIAEKAPPETVRGLYDKALADYQRVLRIDPNDYPGNAWLAALQARTGLYLSEEALLFDAAKTVRVAAKLDRHATEVTPLLISAYQQSIDAASSVRRLP